MMDYIEKLAKLSQYMAYFIDETNMILPHRFYTYPDSVRQYFTERFTKVGFIVTEDQLIFRKKTFEEWLKTN